VGGVCGGGGVVCVVCGVGGGGGGGYVELCTQDFYYRTLATCCP
jgi:hypothetical protein